MPDSKLVAIYEKPLTILDSLGRQMLFYIRVFRSIPRTITNYGKEIVRLLAEVALGSGSLAVIGGTVGVITAMCFFTGTEVGIQGYAALDQLARSRRSLPASRWPRRWDADSRPSWVPCASARRSTRSRSWPSRRCRSS